ncbi:uncharacterized protein EMH_0096460 [Eimeria mitis]|uniref:Transmembrane protein n=1 Tax=Eimeria mitis TaxID=44415 RepID=U6JWP0_9EIME|nr:uncharacterized protein EMH_0096460 [Eimeria mitis]CDJ27933.1 hypothetical protein, conserved [Eimeria mitis]
MGKNDSSSRQESSASATLLRSSVDSGTFSDVNNSLPHSHQHSNTFAGPPVESLGGIDPAECPVAANNYDVKATTTGYELQLPEINEACEPEEESLVPFDRRPSYLQISRRLKRIRVLPALLACFSSLVVTTAICGTEIAIRAVDISSSLALLCSSVVACMLAAFAAHKKSHVLLVGLVMLEVLFTLYSTAFAAVGLVNVGLLRKRQEILEQDDTMQAEQRENALKIAQRMLTEQAIFAGLYFFLAAAHCCAAASVNHLRAAVRPFDSRLRRKRQRARAMEKLNVRPPPREEEAKGAVDRGTKAENFSNDLQQLHFNGVSQDGTPPSHDSHSVEAGEVAELESARNTASSAQRSSSSSGTTSPQMTQESSAKIVEDNHTIA